jgi:hypothetical protein
MHDCENSLIDISEYEWPSFLYPQGTTPDVEDDQAGLFRGYLLLMVCIYLIPLKRLTDFLQVYQQIFTGPRSATHPEIAKKGRSSKARLHNLTMVTARTIAYTCVIVRF